MEASKVGIREFQNKFSCYLLESEASVAITRHGDTVKISPRTLRGAGPLAGCLPRVSPWAIFDSSLREKC